MFIGRERELEALNKLYDSNKFEFMVIYGRRRVGKTALINQFIQDKNAIYFMGMESNAKQNLENFSKSILEYRTGIETDGSFHSFQAALEYVFKLSEQERLILAIDEYPYVARSPSRTRILPFLASANGRTRRSISACRKLWSNAVSCSHINTSTSTSLLNPDSPKGA